MLIKAYSYESETWSLELQEIFEMSKVIKYRIVSKGLGTFREDNQLR